MKMNYKVFALALAGSAVLACSPQEKSPYEDLAQHEMGKVVGEMEVVEGKYGAELEDGFELTNLTEMVQNVEANGNTEAMIQGEIKEVCTKKGCWLSMELPNGESMRVTFKDYGFFVPTNSQGYPVILKGEAILTETDVETLRHYAEDQGKSQEEIEAITEPKREITFEAVGAIIPEKA